MTHFNTGISPDIYLQQAFLIPILASPRIPNADRAVFKPSGIEPKTALIRPRFFD
jgi:hypothetical protein